MGIRMKVKWWALAGVAGLLVASAGAWWMLADFTDARAAEESSYATVQRRDIVSAVAATGKVNAMVGAEVRVGSRVSGRVQRLHANIGDKVQAGQVIAELENDDQRSLLAQRRAELKLADARLSSVESLDPGAIQKAEAALADAQATAELAGTTLTRQVALMERGLVPRESVDSARKERDVTEARAASARRELELSRQRYVEDLKSARAQVEQASAAVGVLEAQVSYSTIKAPIEGIISSVSTQEGETVAAGLNSPIFVTVIDLRKLQVDAFVDETDIGRISVGQSATFTVDSYPTRDFPATVQAIYPKAVIIDNVVYYDVVLRIEEPLTGELRPEMTTNIMIALDAHRGVLAAPLKGISRDQGQYVAYVLRDGKPVRQTVKVGSKDAGWIEITDGLKEHEQVLVGGTPARPEEGR
jgi:multidrug efflux pump subunit AcrA (membrane-fusion protein)